MFMLEAKRGKKGSRKRGANEKNKMKIVHDEIESLSGIHRRRKFHSSPSEKYFCFISLHKFIAAL